MTRTARSTACLMLRGSDGSSTAAQPLAFAFEASRCRAMPATRLPRPFSPMAAAHRQELQISPAARHCRPRRRGDERTDRRGPRRRARAQSSGDPRRARRRERGSEPESLAEPVVRYRSDQRCVLALHSGRLLLQDVQMAEELLAPSVRTGDPSCRRARPRSDRARSRPPMNRSASTATCWWWAAGPSGLAAAAAAAATGARVMLVEDQAGLGGVADLYDGGAVHRAPPAVMVLTRTTALAHFHHNYLLLAERCIGEGPRQRLWKVRAKEVILATGAIERPIAFANNDRPGVMLAEAVRGYLRRYAVAPGSAASSSPTMTRPTSPLSRSGEPAPARSRWSTAPASRGRTSSAGRPKAAGIEILAGHAIAGVESGPAASRSTVQGRSIAGGKAAAQRKPIALRLSSRCPAATTRSSICGAHNGGKVTFDSGLQSFKPGKHHDRSGLSATPTARWISGLPE